MNTEATQDHQEANTTGARLRNAREQLGLSQQAVAERLCLKVSTVRDIEDDKAPADLASTFLRGYIRSYTRLVHIPEEELLPMMAKALSQGRAAGGRDNGGPGLRDYHPGYYGAFLLDPDGNNIEAVYHGEARRSAPSVEIAF